MVSDATDTYLVRANYGSFKGMVPEVRPVFKPIPPMTPEERLKLVREAATRLLKEQRPGIVLVEVAQ